MIEAFNIPILICDGYEADDIIGTLATKAAREGFTTYMVTPDKDFGQLVFAQRQRSAGVVLIRYPSKIRKSLPAAVLDFVEQFGASLNGRLAVLRPGRLRIVSKPGE